MNDLATLGAKPKPLTVGGRTHLIHPLTVDDLGSLQSWVDTQFPDPFDVASNAIERGRPGPEGTRTPYTTAQQKHLYEVALERATRGTPKLGTPEADALLQSAAGVRELLFVAIRKGDPGFTRAAAEALFREMGVGDVARVFRQTNAADVATSDPKAAASSPDGETPTPRARPRPTGGPSTTGP